MANVTPANLGKRRPEPPGKSGLAHDEQTRSVARRLGKCPICSYNLRGLPSTHCCPECGFHYDSQTRIWRPLKPKAIFGGLFGFVGGSIGVVLFVADSPRIGLPVLVLWIGLASYVSWRFYSIYKRGQFVCVGPDGIRYRLQKTEAQLILWKDIAAIHRLRFDKLCRVERIGDLKQVLLQDVFSSPADTLEFADLANQLLRVARTTNREDTRPAPD